MKVEITIAIEANLLAQAESVAKDFESISEVFENALRFYLPTLDNLEMQDDLQNEV